MKVIATAKIIAVRTRLLDWPPPALELTLIVFSPRHQPIDVRLAWRRIANKDQLANVLFGPGE
jgi:hypothetical protein